jgi:23S rRNA (adenine2030-N6)-methyltransferase
MNYRHAFHAGNFADVLKHLVLAGCLRRMMVKEKALSLIDLFAGIGWYDLGSEEAQRSPEWQLGIGKVRAAVEQQPETVPSLVTDWLADIGQTCSLLDLDPAAIYPGSPALMAAARRGQDRLTLCELHQVDGRTLYDRFGHQAGVLVEWADGWRAIRRLVPPPSRRGLILIDPPFEQAGEFDRMAQALRDGLERFATGTYLFWYACKDRGLTQHWRDEVAQTGARCLDVHLAVGDSRTLSGLLRAGVMVVNPPFGLEEALNPALEWLCPLLARGPGAAWHVQRICGVW